VKIVIINVIILLILSLNMDSIIVIKTANIMLHKTIYIVDKLNTLLNTSNLKHISIYKIENILKINKLYFFIKPHPILMISKYYFLYNNMYETKRK
jgi:hypothetical protein